MTQLKEAGTAEVLAVLRGRQEIAFIDVREEDPYAQGHPLWAVNLALSRLELDAWTRIPRKTTPIVVYGEHDGTDLATHAAAVLVELGYTDVRLLGGGLAGWIGAGGEIFRDVNVPSKAFGELVTSLCQTPSLPAEEVAALLDAGADVVVLDARRFDEYATMSIPAAVSVPGGELVLRIGELAPDPRTRVIVNCAGRTRSIIGTQSLINAGVPNPVTALRNGTIGWTLAGQQLDRGASRRWPEQIDLHWRESARTRAHDLATHVGVKHLPAADIDGLISPDRTTYRFDVRTPEEYAAGHLPGFLSTPGGQLVQETDHHAAVRGARIVLSDDDGVRANMTGSWLAQMGWEVWVVEPGSGLDASEIGFPDPPRPVAPTAKLAAVAEVTDWLADPSSHTVLIDLAPSRDYSAGHLPGAWFAIRAQLPAALARIGPADRYVLTCGSGLLARYAAADLARMTRAEVVVLDGGNAAWRRSGRPESVEPRWAVPATDRYRRPYEGTDNAAEAMQSYLDWEFGLVEQLSRDGTHHFDVLH
jgi:rhodanese-related sulfurtransferase